MVTMNELEAQLRDAQEQQSALFRSARLLVDALKKWQSSTKHLDIPDSVRAPVNVALQGFEDVLDEIERNSETDPMPSTAQAICLCLRCKSTFCGYRDTETRIKETQTQVESALVLQRNLIQALEALRDDLDWSSMPGPKQEEFAEMVRSLKRMAGMTESPPMPTSPETIQ